MVAGKISDSALPLTLGGDALSLTATSATGRKMSVCN